MSVPVASVTLADRERAPRGAARPAGARTPPRRRPRRWCRATSAGRSRSGAREHGEVAVRDRRRRRCARTSEPSLRSTIVSSSPATTCALVTTRPSPTTNPLPSWMRSHATPSTFTVDGTTASTTACGMLRRGRRRARRRAPARARRTPGGTGPRRPAGGACRRCRAARGSGRRRTGRSSTTRACGGEPPGHVGHERHEDPDADEDADHARHRAGRRGRPTRTRRARAAWRAAGRPTSSPSAWPTNAVPSRMPTVTNRSCGGAGVARAARSTGGSTRRADHHAERPARPTTTTRARNPRR